MKRELKVGDRVAIYFGEKPGELNYRETGLIMETIKHAAVANALGVKET